MGSLCGRRSVLCSDLSGPSHTGSDHEESLLHSGVLSGPSSEEEDGLVDDFIVHVVLLCCLLGGSEPCWKFFFLIDSRELIPRGFDLAKCQPSTDTGD